MRVLKVEETEVVGKTSMERSALLLSGYLQAGFDRVIKIFGNWNRIIEMENKNLAKGQMTHNDSFYDNKPTNLLENADVLSGDYDPAGDDDLSTYIEQSGGGDFFVLDIGEIINNDFIIVIKIERQGTYGGNLYICTSQDNSTWNCFRPPCGTPYMGNYSFEGYIIKTLSFRYIKVKHNIQESSDVAKLYHFKLYRLSDYLEYLLSVGNNLGYREYCYPFYPIQKYILLHTLDNMRAYVENCSECKQVTINGFVDKGNYAVIDGNKIFFVEGHDENNSKIGYLFYEHIKEKDYEEYVLHAKEKDVAVVVEGSSYNYRIIDLDYVNGVTKVIEVIE